MTIVVGHDGSDSGDDAGVLGAQLAASTGEDLVVISVYPEENPIGVGRVDAEWVAYMREQAEAHCAEAQRFLSGVEATFRVVGSHSAAHGLDDVAEETHASLIVVGSSPRAARRRVLAGATGEGPVRLGACPGGLCLLCLL